MQWKEVYGYEGCYQVSNTGRVKSVERIVNDSKTKSKRIAGKEMSITVNKAGYGVVNLHKQGKSEVALVHRLVAEAFLLNPNELPTVNHIDGNKTNNDVSNLEWASYAANNTHAINQHLRKPRGCAVLQLTSDGKIVNSFESVSEAARTTGVSRGMISHCVNSRSKLAGGYAWKKIGKCNDYLEYESTTEDELPLEVQEQEFLKI